MNLNCHKSVSNITKFSCKETVILLSRPFCNLHTHILRSVLGYILVQHLVNVCAVDLKFSFVNCKSQGYGKMMLKGSEDNIAFSFNYCFMTWEACLQNILLYSSRIQVFPCWCGSRILLNLIVGFSILRRSSFLSWASHGIYWAALDRLSILIWVEYPCPSGAYLRGRHRPKFNQEAKLGLAIL